MNQPFLNMEQTFTLDVTVVLCLLLLSTCIYFYSQLIKTRKRLAIIKSRAKQSNKSAHQFISDRITELRRPLKGLLGIQNLKATHESPINNTGQLEIVDYCVKYIIRQLDRLQMYTEIESSNVQIERTEFSIKQLISDAVVLTTEQTNRRDDPVKVEIADSLNQNYSGYEKIIRTMLVEVLDNSFRYAPKGAIRIQVQPDEFNMRQISVAISDSGPGVEKEKIIFLNNSYKGRSKNQSRLWPQSRKGLGYLILKRLATKIDAKIYVTTHRGVGTSISLVFSEASMRPALPAAIKHGVAESVGLPSLSPDVSAENLSNVVSFERAKARKAANSKSSSGYYIDFNKMFQMLDENMTLCQDVLKQTAEEIEQNLEAMSGALSKNDANNLMLLLKNMVSNLTLIHCPQGVQKTEALLKSLSENIEKNEVVAFTLTDYFDFIEDVMSEVDRLLSEESNSGSAA